MNKLCECGCGKEVTYNFNLKHINRFCHGHNRRDVKISFSGETRQKMSEAKKGTYRSPESIAKTALSNSGTTRTAEQKRHIHESKLNKPLSEIHRRAIALSHIGKKDSQETKNRKRLALKKYRREHQITGWTPAKGKYEKEVFTEFQNHVSFQLLENQQFLQYSPDRYIKELNLIIELYEPCHKNVKWIKYDTYRQKELEDHLGCKFFIIWLSDWKVNKDRVLSNFALLLNDGLTDDKPNLLINN